MQGRANRGGGRGVIAVHVLANYADVPPLDPSVLFLAKLLICPNTQCQKGPRRTFVIPRLSMRTIVSIALISFALPAVGIC